MSHALDMSIAVTDAAEDSARLDEQLGPFFVKAIEEELDFCVGQATISGLTFEINQRLVKQYGMRFVAYVVDDETEEPATNDATVVTFVLDALYQYNNTTSH